MCAIASSQFFGNVYTCYVDFHSFSGGNGFPLFPYVATSTDGGETFVKTADIGLGHFLMDKPYMTIDPVSGALYVVWTDFGTHPGPQDVRIFFSASVDHGATFTAPRQISGGASFGSWATADVGPGGEIYATWSAEYYPALRIWFDRSLDGGRTWLSRDVRIADYPSGGVRKGGGFGWPTVAVDLGDIAAEKPGIGHM